MDNYYSLKFLIFIFHRNDRIQEITGTVVSQKLTGDWHDKVYRHGPSACIIRNHLLTKPIIVICRKLIGDRHDVTKHGPSACIIRNHLPTKPRIVICRKLIGDRHNVTKHGPSACIRSHPLTKKRIVFQHKFTIIQIEVNIEQ